jgi:Protein of unknown function (DUF2637)
MNTLLAQTVVPAWIAAALGVATVAMFLGVLLLVARYRRAAAQHNPTLRDEKVLRRLFIAALIPTLVVIGAVMGISFVGLSSFARHDMGWHSWISLIVPLSLDGISITFGFWAFVAVKRGRHPGRSERIVYVGALISAWINFNHGRQEWTGAAGIYLGFLSLASAWMFHELLSQFMDAQAALPKAHRNGTPMFGERWLWAFWSTLMARRAWVVYPPTPDVEPTAANALVHLDTVRANRATRRLRHKATVDAIARNLAHPNTNITAAPVITPAAAPTARIVRPSTTDTDPVVASAPVPDLAPVGSPIPTPAVVAERITPRPQPRPRPTPAPVSGPAPRTTRTSTSRPSTPATRLPASSTDSPVTATEPVQPPLPMVPPELLARSTEIARAYRAEHGTRISPGQLAVRLRVTTEQAAHLLAAIDDTPTIDRSVNGTPVRGLR